jgi:agmatine deiminase
MAHGSATSTSKGKSPTVRIALIQSRVGKNPKTNVENTVTMIRRAARKGAKVVCLQELFQTRYFPVDEYADHRRLAETIPGKTTSTLSRLARELGVVIVAPIYEVADGRYFNSAAVIDADGALLGTYRKVHIPHDPFFYEQSYFESGNLGYRVFKTRHLNLSVLICYDQWFPEAARAVTLEGADLIFYPTAIGHLKGDPLPREDWANAWTTIQRSHAIANSVHVAAVNRVGTEEPVSFYGASFVCDAFGRVLSKGGSKDSIVIADVDLSMNARIREGWRFMKNRHPESYAPLTAPMPPDTPRQLGFRMPAEWAPHESTWLAWPEDKVTFPRRIERARAQYVRIIEVLHRSEVVNLVVKDAAARATASKLLKKAGVDLDKVRIHVWDYADVWFRDYGPTFVVDREGHSAIVQWRFNAWGNKYPSLLKDGHAPYFISEQLGLNLFRPNIVLEGGSIDVNGEGTVLTTEQCLLNENRNPGRSREDIERILDENIGASHVIWLKSGIEGDDTDGHIDNLARFVDPNTVVCAFEEDPADANYAALNENYEILCASTDQNGRPLRVIKLPMPPARYDVVRGKKRRLSASYANFYIANGVALIPSYAHENDVIAQNILRELLPGRLIAPIDCRDIVYGAGALHCITQQQPLGAGRT